MTQPLQPVFFSFKHHFSFSFMLTFSFSLSF